MIRKHYVAFYSAGGFYADINIKKITSRKSKFKIPDSCYGYRLFSINSIGRGKSVMDSDWLNVSGMHFIGGEIYTLYRVKKHSPNLKQLISNMEINRIKKVVKTRKGNWVVFDEKDKIIADV